jgi:hypothetical protein
MLCVRAHGGWLPARILHQREDWRRHERTECAARDGGTTGATDDAACTLVTYAF